jgi:hypothetical protein
LLFRHVQNWQKQAGEKMTGVGIKNDVGQFFCSLTICEIVRKAFGFGQRQSMLIYVIT